MPRDYALDAAASVGGDLNLVPDGFEQYPEALQHVGIVIDDENPFLLGAACSKIGLVRRRHGLRQWQPDLERASFAEAGAGDRHATAVETSHLFNQGQSQTHSSRFDRADGSLTKRLKNVRQLFRRNSRAIIDDSQERVVVFP